MKILFWTGYNDGVFKTMENVDSNFDSDRGWGSEGSLCRLAVGLNVRTRSRYSESLNITSIPCHKIKGEVILKEIQEEE